MNNENFLKLPKEIGDAINVSSGNKMFGFTYTLMENGPAWWGFADGEKFLTDGEVLELGNVVQYYRPVPEGSKNGQASVGIEETKAQRFIRRIGRKLRGIRASGNSRL